jgi:hypothetical protein
MRNPALDRCTITARTGHPDSFTKDSRTSGVAEIGAA